MGMTERDKRILIVVLVLVVLGGYWFLVLGNKRSAVAEAEKAKVDAQAALDNAIAAETAAKAVKAKKPVAYSKLVRLGAAIPTDDDFQSLLVQVSDIADDADVDFHDLTVANNAPGTATGGGPTAAVGGSSCDAGATPAAGATATTGASAAAGSTAQTWVGRDKAKAENAAAQATARNAAAACAAAPTLADLSAQAAGLTTYKYTLTFKGSFFNLDTMFGDLLGMVKTHNGKVSMTGRLLDIGMINMSVETFPILNASVQMTGYSLPLGAATPAAAAPTPATGVPAATTTGNGQ